MRANGEAGAGTLPSLADQVRGLGLGTSQTSQRAGSGTGVADTTEATGKSVGASTDGAASEVQRSLSPLLPRTGRVVGEAGRAAGEAASASGQAAAQVLRDLPDEVPPPVGTGGR